MSKKYYAEHRDEILLKQKEYYHKNKDKILEREKRHRNKPDVFQKRQEYLKEYRELNRDVIRAKYNENKQHYRVYDKERKAARRRLVGEIQLQYGCMNPNCKWQGEFESCQLDFHHVDPSCKYERVSVMLNYSMVRLAEEINKCVVLCRNCHQSLHYGEIQLNEIMLCCVNDDLEIIE